MRKSLQQNVGAATPTKICKRGRKPNVNVIYKKKTAVVDFVELALLLGDYEPHLKIYFRRREELKVRG